MAVSRMTNRLYSRGLVGMLDSLEQYAEAYSREFDCNLADDHVLGEAWREMLGSFMTLLNGNLGAEDGATLDGRARQIADKAGFDGQLL